MTDISCIDHCARQIIGLHVHVVCKMPLHFPRATREQTTGQKFHNIFKKYPNSGIW